MSYDLREKLIERGVDVSIIDKMGVLVIGVPPEDICRSLTYVSLHTKKPQLKFNPQFADHGIMKINVDAAAMLKEQNYSGGTLDLYPSYVMQDKNSPINLIGSAIDAIRRRLTDFRKGGYGTSVGFAIPIIPGDKNNVVRTAIPRNKMGEFNEYAVTAKEMFFDELARLKANLDQYKEDSKIEKERLLDRMLVDVDRHDKEIVKATWLAWFLSKFQTAADLDKECRFDIIAEYCTYSLEAQRLEAEQRIAAARTEEEVARERELARQITEQAKSRADDIVLTVVAQFRQDLYDALVDIRNSAFKDNADGTTSITRGAYARISNLHERVRGVFYGDTHYEQKLQELEDSFKLDNRKGQNPEDLRNLMNEVIEDARVGSTAVNTAIYGRFSID